VWHGTPTRRKYSICGGESALAISLKTQNSTLKTQNSKLKTLKMTALLIDDESDARGVLRHLLERFCPHITVCAEANSVADGLAAIQHHQPDLVFLDVDLRSGNGFDILDAYPRPAFKVVFVTAHDDFALRAFQYRAFHYLLKPIDPQDLIAVVNELTARDDARQTDALRSESHTSTGKLLLPTVQGTAVLHPDEISHVVAEDGYPMLVLESGERILVSYTLRTLFDLLPQAAFVRTHKSYIVRIGAVRRVHRGEMVTLLLRDKTVVPVARRNREEVLRRLGM